MQLISRAEAQAGGLKRYFTGKPCRHGHIAERYTSTFACVECVAAAASLSQSRAVNKPYELISREDARAANRRWYFTGELCAQGHVAQRSVVTGNCRACDQAAKTGLVDVVLTVPERDLALVKRIVEDLRRGC